MTQEQVDSKWNDLSLALETASNLANELGLHRNSTDSTVTTAVKSHYDSLKPFMDERFNTVRPVGWTPEQG